MRLTWLLTVVLVLAGCAPVAVYDVKIENPNDGAVLLRTVSSMPILMMGGYGKAIGIESVVTTPGERSRYYMLLPTSDATTRSTVYASTLPPGIYRFTGFQRSKCNPVCVLDEMPPGRLSFFEVRSGQLTDLGEIIEVLRGDDLLFIPSKQANRDITADVVPQLVPGLLPLLSKPTVSWSAGTFAPEVDTQFEQAKKESYGVTSVRATADGRFIYGSANGVVYSWRPGQHPLPHDIGSRVSVEALLVTATGSWLAGGELGVLKQSDDQGKTWRSIRGNLPFGLVTDLISWNGKVIATAMRAGEVFIYAAEQGSDQWTPLARYPSVVSLLSDGAYLRAHSVLLGDTLITSIPARQFARLDLRSGQSRIGELPGTVHAFTVAPDGVLNCRCWDLAMNPYESHDQGQTWAYASASRGMTIPVWRDSKNAIGFTGGPFGPNVLNYTTDGGKTWGETSGPTPVFTELFYSPDGKTAYAAAPEGVFWRSTDNGRNWQPVVRN